MNTCHPRTLIHGNPVHLYHSWEPCAASLFFKLEPIGNSLCWVFFQDHCISFIGLALCDVHLCELQVHALPVPAPIAKRTTCSHSICERNFFITLPPWALIPFVEEKTPWEAFNWGVNIIHRNTTLLKSLNLWVWTQLYYINSPTSLLFFHVGLPLTHVYPTIKLLGKVLAHSRLKPWWALSSQSCIKQKEQFLLY